jgi:glycosyltransferase involved in cell wall biosynthesis
MSEPERVLFVAHSPQVSGAEKVMLDLVSHAVASGLDAIVACPAGPLSAALPAGCAHLPIPPLGLGGAQGIARVTSLAELVRRWTRAAAQMRPVARRPGTATVVNALMALPAVRLARPVGGAAYLAHDTIVNTRQRMVIKGVRPVVRTAVAVSEATAAPLRELGLPVAVAHNGVRWPVPQLGGALHRPPVVGMTALLTPWKGHRVLLDAIGQLHDVHVELAGGVFPGDQEYADALRDRAEQPDLAGRVRFLGHVNVADTLPCWDVAVSASVLPEAGPLSVLEAMSHGIPVVGTDHGGTSEFLSSGAGVLVPPGDADALAGAIAGLLGDDALRSAIAESARARVAAEHDIAKTLPLLFDALVSGRAAQER